MPLASDELATVSLWAQMPYLKIFTNYQYPNNHIFLTFILSVLLKTFGLNEWLLRLPVLLCGLVSIYLSYLLSRKISGNSFVGFATAFLMVVSEKHIFFSTNARGYLLVMVLALMAMTSLFKRLEGGVLKIPKLSHGLNCGLAFSGWLGIWVLGTWTIPTFLFFEVSLALFLMGCLLTGKVLPSPQKKLLMIPFVSIVLGSIACYLQYYVFIDSKMLAEATSHAAKSSLPLFFPELLAQWTSPFESLGIIFFLFALLGLVRVFKKNKAVGLLLACAWLGPVVIAMVGFLLEELPGVPHSRTFFYLQPFFLMLSVMGVEQGYSALRRHKPDLIGKSFLVVAGILAVLIAGYKFFQHTYPQRLSREPLHRVRDFVKNLNQHDLLLVSSEIHVEFFLYGADEMRSRAENILREGKLKNIYFLEYKKNNVPQVHPSDKKEVLYLHFPVLTRNAKKEGPMFPAEAVEKVDQFGAFVFYRLKSDWLHRLPGWKHTGQGTDFLKPGVFRWKNASDASGVRPQIQFENSFVLTQEYKVPLFHRDTGMTLNLMEISGNDELFSAVLLGGKGKPDKIIFEPSWLPNAWTFDHPYGRDVFSHPWNPVAFISQGTGRFSVMDVKLTQRTGHGVLRNILSYRIDKPEMNKQ